MNLLLLALLNATHSPRSLETVQCARSIFTNFRSFYRIVAYENDSSLFIDEIARFGFELSLQLTDISAVKSRVYLDDRAKFVCILTGSLTGLKKYVGLIGKNANFDPTLRYFIVYTGNEDVNGIFEVLVQLYIQRVIVLDRQNNFYTSMPYEVGCGRNNRKVYLSHCKDFKLEVLRGIFTRKSVNFNKCTFKVFALIRPPFVVDVSNAEAPGIEPELLGLLESRYNFTLEYVKSASRNKGSKMANGTYTYTLGELGQAKADILVGNVRTNATYLEDFSAGPPYFNTRTLMYVPAPKLASRWSAIAHVFTVQVWFFVLLTLAVKILTIHLVNDLDHIPEHITTLNLIAVALNKPTRQPLRSSNRNFFLVWTWYCYFILAFFESTFLAFLIKPTFEEPIDTYEKLIATNLDIGGSGNAKALFAMYDDQVYKTLYQRWTECEQYNCMNRTLKGTMATAQSDYFVQYYTNKYLDHDLKSYFHTIKSSVMVYSWIVMRKGLPLVLPLTDVVIRLPEHGFTLRWKKKYLPTFKRVEEKKVLPIVMDQMLLTFYLYIAGILIALIVLALEYYYPPIKEEVVRFIYLS